ncbi:MAG: hypothetical protein JW874_06760 [Spirochaetales bacterium]|nr:hypothetical protein [Spirochaetales bacterium]
MDSYDMNLKINTLVLSLLLLLLPVPGLFADQVIDTGLFLFDRKVDDSFVDRYASGHPDFFSDFFAIDSIRDKDRQLVYGVGADKRKNVLYYFDEDRHNDYYAINHDTKKTRLNLVDKVAVTDHGRIFAIDAIDEYIAWWDVGGDRFNPAGTIRADFENLEDICYDGSGVLYILDNTAKRLYKYSVTGNKFLDFDYQQENYLYYNKYITRSWGRARGLAVKDDAIFIVFECGKILKLSSTGECTGSFYMNSENINLVSRSGHPENSTSWWTSIAIGPMGNIYVLDDIDRKIHVFTDKLEYICSWYDPQHPIGANASDISFVNSFQGLLISHDWGFYSFQLSAKLAGIHCNTTSLYPDYICDEYKGIEAAISIIGRGSLDIGLLSGSEEMKLLDNYSMAKNERYTFIWDGSDRAGNILSPGKYMLRFYLNDVFDSQIQIEIKKGPVLTITPPANAVIDSQIKSLTYSYHINEDARISVYCRGSGSQHTFRNGNISAGTYSCTVTESMLGNTPVDGYYHVYFETIPNELYQQGIKAVNTRSELFMIDYYPLQMGTVTTCTGGFNPDNAEFATMYGSFSISEDATVTVQVRKQNGTILATITGKEEKESGTNVISWDGKIDANTRAPDSNYYFRVIAEQPLVGISLSGNSGLFALDTTPPVIKIADEQDIYFLSPDEYSSVGIQDSLQASFIVNEQASVCAEIQDMSTLTERTLFSGYSLGPDIPKSVGWNGRNNASVFSDDGVYRLVMKASDVYGNTSAKTVKIIIDNNRWPETPDDETILIAGEESTIASGKTGDSDIAYCNDRIILVYTDYDGSDLGIYARRYDSDGTLLGKAFQVNSITTGTQSGPVIAATDNGFAAAWSYSKDSFSPVGIFIRCFDKNGNPLGNEALIVNHQLNTVNMAPAIAANKNGYILTWFLVNHDDGTRKINAQRFSTDGTPLGEVFQVNTSSQLKQLHPDIAANENGFTITWFSLGKDDNSVDVYARRYDPDGNALGAEFKVNSSSQGSHEYPAIAMHENGFAIAWNSSNEDKTDYKIYARCYNSNGTPLGKEFTLNEDPGNPTHHAAISAINNQFIVTWHCLNMNNGKTGIYARRFDSGGSMPESEFLVSSNTDGVFVGPDLVHSDNEIFITWPDKKAGDDYPVLFRKYEIYHVLSGDNLTAKFLSPALTHTGRDDFSIEAMALDMNIDHYSLSITNNNTAKTLLTEQGKTVSGDMYWFNILDAEQGDRNTVTLEVWDKAGNYRSDSFALTREYESLIKNFTVSSYYVSTIQPLKASCLLAGQCSVEFDIENSGGTVVRSQSCGTMDSAADLQIDCANLADGEYFLCLKAKNAKATSEGRKNFIIDNSKPLLAFGEIEPFFTNEQEVPVPLTVNEENPYMATLTLLDSAGVILKVIADGSSMAELKHAVMTPASYDEGTYSLSLSVKDSAGNSGKANKTFYIDRTAPQLAFADPDFTSAYGASVHFLGAITDAGGFDEYELYYYPDSGTPVFICSGSGTTIDHIWSTAALGKGIFTGNIICRLKDIAGNESEHCEMLVIDHNAPLPVVSFNDQPYADVSGLQYISGKNIIYLSADPGDGYSAISAIRYRINNSDFSDYSGPVVFDSSGHYFFDYLAVDTFGNSSDIKNLDFYVDTEPPLCGTETAPPKYEKDGHTFIPAENNITLQPRDTVSPNSSGLRSCEYKINDGAWEIYESGLSIYSDGITVLWARVIDNVGNISESVLAEFIVDIAPPQTVYTIDGTFYQSLHRNIIALASPAPVSLSAADTGPVEFQSGLSGTCVCIDGSEQDYTEPFQISSTIPAEYIFFSRDNVGNKEAGTSISIAVDTQAPTVTCVLPEHIYTSGGVVYASGGSLFALEAADNFSGVREIAYRFSNGDFLEYETPFSREEETALALQYYAEDNMGLLSAMGETIISIDNSAPHTELITSIPLIVRDGISYADTRYLFSLHPVDAKSGTAQTVITVDGESISGLTFGLETEGQHCIEYYSIDNLGHKEAMNVLYVTTPIPDITPPVSEISHSVEPYRGENMDYYRSDVEFTITAEDVIGEFDSFASGLKFIMISVDGSSYAEYEVGTAVVFSEDGLHSISYYAEDLAGNAEPALSYPFTIDDSAPVSKLGFDRSKVIEIGGVLQINKSAVIEIIAEDLYCGVNTIYYSIGDGEFCVYEGPVSPGNGYYEFEWYAVDYLGNTECIHKQNIQIENDYNEIAFDTNYIRGVDDRIDDYSVYGDMVAYLKGTHAEHLYIKLIRGEDTNLWAHSRKLTAWKQDRIQVALGEKRAACVEIRNGTRELYLYNLWDYSQYGCAVAVSGRPRDPLFLDGKLYWISENDIHQIVNEYDTETQETSVLFETGGTVQSLKKNDGILSLLETTDSGQKVYSYEDGTVTCRFACNEAETVITDFSYGRGLLALEFSDNSESPEISLYHYPETDPVLLDTLAGRKPIVDGFRIYSVKTVGEDDIVFMRNAVTGNDSHIIKAPEIKEIRMTERKDLMVRRVNDYRAMNMFNNFFFHNGYLTGRNMYDYMQHYVSEDFIFLKAEESDNLIGNIRYTSGNTVFAYNKFCDEEDFIYADELIAFPPYFGFEWELHQLQTFNKERVSEGKESVSFSALKDVTVYVLSDSGNRSRFEEKNRHRHHNRFNLMNDWRDRFLLLEMRFLSPFFRFDINVYELDAGEELILDELDPEYSAPLILIREQK